jgi:hypothetical protein
MIWFPWASPGGYPYGNSYYFVGWQFEYQRPNWFIAITEWTTLLVLYAGLFAVLKQRGPTRE